MKKHYELIESIPWKYLPAKNCCGIALLLCLQMCVNMAHPTQLSVEGGDYVDNAKMIHLNINRDSTK
jgi:hypothetical protein